MPTTQPDPQPPSSTSPQSREEIAPPPGPAWPIFAAALAIGGAVAVLNDIRQAAWAPWLFTHWRLWLGVGLLVAAAVVVVMRKARVRGIKAAAERSPRTPDEKRTAREWTVEQMGYYEDEISTNLWMYASLKVPAVIFAASLPVIAIASNHAELVRWSAGILGALIAIFDGVQHLFRYRETWIRAVDTREKLEHEVARFDVGAGDYKDAARRDTVLIERATAIVAEEFSAWSTALQQATTDGKGTVTRTTGEEGAPADKPPKAHKPAEEAPKKETT